MTIRHLAPMLLLSLSLSSLPAAAQEVSAPSPVAAPSQDRLTPVLRSLYVSTAVLQGLDVHSTLRGLQAGNRESNAVMRGLVARPALLIGVKAGAGGALIAASHQMSKRDKVAAIVMLAAVNTMYTAVVIHNYRIAR